MRQWKYPNPRDIFQFISILFRDKKIFISLLDSTKHRWQQAIHSSQSPIQPQFSKKQKIGQLICMRDITFIDEKQYRHSHRQIKTRTDFLDI
jgi:hypothetical protein